MIEIGSYVKPLGRGLVSKNIYYEDSKLKGTISQINKRIARVEFGLDNLLYDEFKLSQLTEYVPNLSNKREIMIQSITGDRYTSEWNNFEAEQMVDMYISIFSKLDKDEIEYLDTATDEFTNEHFTLLRMILNSEDF